MHHVVVNSNSRRLGLGLGALLAAALLLAMPGPAAAAAPTLEEDDTETAVQGGIALRRAGDDESALTVFLELEQRSPSSVRVLLHITAAAQATGRWMLAYQYLRKAAAFKNDPYYLRNRAAIKNVEDAVAQHIGQFRVLGEPAGAEVRLSGDLIGKLPMTEPVAVEIGSYLLEVSRPGFFPLRRQIMLTGGGALVQESVELKRGVVAPVAEPEQQQLPSARQAGSLPRADRAWWEARSVTWALGGLTLAAGATTAVALVVRQQQADHWNDDARCLDLGDASRSRAQVCGGVHDSVEAAERVGVTAGVATAVLGTATLVQWLARSPEPAKVNAHASVGARCAPGLGSLVCFGTF